MKLRAAVVAGMTALSSLALLVPQAHASGSVCYSVQVTVNGEDAVNQAGCQDLP
jgi:hypothetical protein